VLWVRQRPDAVIANDDPDGFRLDIDQHLDLSFSGIVAVGVQDGVANGFGNSSVDRPGPIDPEPLQVTANLVPDVRHDLGHGRHHKPQRAGVLF
jgi:hypothetical protein